MPTYEYVCEKCGHEFEKFQSMADKPLRICPENRCAQKHWGKGKVKKLISSGAGLIFKGSGFYITDYRSEGYKESAKNESGTSANTSKTEKSANDKPAAAGDSKPAPKAETKPAKPAKSKE